MVDIKCEEHMDMISYALAYDLKYTEFEYINTSDVWTFRLYGTKRVSRSEGPFLDKDLRKIVLLSL